MSNNKIEQFINRTKLSKTLRFRLIPQGKTEEFMRAGVLNSDEGRGVAYVRLKELIKDYHRKYISQRLSMVKLDKLHEFSELYGQDENDKNYKELDASLRKQIVDVLLGKDKNEKNAINESLFGAKIIDNILNDELNESDKVVVEKFSNFKTYTNDFQSNLKNIYGNEKKSTEVVNRIIGDNLPKFLDNIKISKKLLDKIEDIGEDIFEVEYFNQALNQEGIDVYNDEIGKINTKINLYNQANGTHLPLLKVLFKQILADKQSEFVIDEFKKDCKPSEIIEAINIFYNTITCPLDNNKSIIDNLDYLFKQQIKNGIDGIYVDAKYVTNISQKLFGDWNKIHELLSIQYDNEHTEKQRQNGKYTENKDKYFDNKKCYSLSDLQKCDISADDLCNKLCEIFIDKKTIIDDKYDNYQKYSYDKNIYQDERATEVIKEFLDSLLELYRFTKMFECGHDGEENSEFYGILTSCNSELSNIVALYNKVRNYVTQKPYSDSKIRLCFNNYQLLAGWSKTKEKDYRSMLLRKNGLYYLGIIDKDVEYPKLPEYIKGDYYEKMEYFQMAAPMNTFPKLMIIDGKSQMKRANSEELKKYYNQYLPASINESMKKYGFGINKVKAGEKAFVEFVDYYKKCIVGYYPDLIFRFKPSEEYNSFEEFGIDVAQQAYQLNFVNIEKSFIDNLVESGQLYLFQIYNKDFSTNKKAKGTDNLHTMYFKMLFDEENLKDTVFKLSGDGKIFCRKASLPLNVTHPKNVPLDNKNKLNGDKKNVFEYDLIKDKRYTHDEYSLHMPIEINFNATGNKSTRLNVAVRKAICQSEHNYLIGIDRGERNLLSVCVIDETGKIVEQYSANVIKTEYNGTFHETDYHAILDKREEERDNARKNWQCIEGIKNLKEGYLSIAIHKICELIEKYDATIVLEKLNMGFKNSRGKFEKQVYQKFEKMLTDKLNYLAFKNKPLHENGSILHGYQLCDAWKDEVNQNGFIFYIPAAYTSKIDPSTGFVNLLAIKYESELQAKEYISKFEKIAYNKKDDCFVFEFNYENFERTSEVYKKEWSVYSYGDRIRRIKNKATGKWDGCEKVNLTKSLKGLFDANGIEYLSGNDLKPVILQLEKGKKSFFEELFKLMNLTLQMRNSNSATNEDYIISPVKNDSGKFFDSRLADDSMPKDADANGAYHIALEGLMIVNRIKNCASADELEDNNLLKITKSEWFKERQGK